VTALVTAAIAAGAAVLGSSATAFAVRRPRYVGRHRAPF
jgi:hypothetical protein